MSRRGPRIRVLNDRVDPKVRRPSVAVLEYRSAKLLPRFQEAKRSLRNSISGILFLIGPSVTVDRPFMSLLSRV